MSFAYQTMTSRLSARPLLSGPGTPRKRLRQVSAASAALGRCAEALDGAALASSRPREARPASDLAKRRASGGLRGFRSDPGASRAEGSSSKRHGLPRPACSPNGRVQVRCCRSPWPSPFTIRISLHGSAHLLVWGSPRRATGGRHPQEALALAVRIPSTGMPKQSISVYLE